MKAIRSQYVRPFTLDVYYERKSRLFRIVVTHADGRSKTDFVRSTYEPVFGIDVRDNFAINEKAEAMCLGFEKEGNMITTRSGSSDRV